MMKKEMNMSPVFETTSTNFGGTFYQGVNQTDALLAAKQVGFETTVTKDNKLFATYSPISGMKYYSN
jgi:hypothetical protein